MVAKKEEREKEGGGRGQSSSRLHRTQNVYSIGFCFAGIFLLRWPGWYFLQMHLWECVRVGVAGFLVWQSVVVGALMVGSAVVWVMGNGWKEKEKEKKAVRGSEEDCYYISSFGGGDAAEKGVRFDDGSEMTPTSSASFRFKKGDMPRKHPSSVGMGRFLKDMNLEGFNDTFIAREREGNREMTVVYHSICSREQHWESSFEELRLQDYKKMGKFVAFAPPLPPPPPATNTTNTTISRQQQPRRSAFDGGGGGGEGGRWAGVKQALPSWLSSRTFGESAFDCSISSYGSNDELSSIGRIDASLLAAGLASSPVPFHAQPEDMGTESGVVRRRFT